MRLRIKPKPIASPRRDAVRHCANPGLLLEINDNIKPLGKQQMRCKRVYCQQSVNMGVSLQQRDTFLIHQPSDVIMIGGKQMQDHRGSQNVAEADNTAAIRIQRFAVAGFMMRTRLRLSAAAGLVVCIIFN